VRALGVERAGLLTGILPVSALVVAALLGRADLTAGRLAGALLVGAGIAAGLLAQRPVRLLAREEIGRSGSPLG
jgi:hypothetical protein